jgi:hypothetical protein
MALFGQSFNVNELPESQSYDLIPDGWYDAIITKADLKPTKDQTGERLNIRYDILGPTHQGRVVFVGINIKNKSAAAEEIGRQQLGSIMRAGGIPSLDDSDQLIGLRMQIKVKTRTQDGYDPSNDVSGFKAIEGAMLPPVSKPAAATAASAGDTTGKAAPPWAKK